MLRFRLAESFLKSGQVERAIPILEDLYQADSTAYPFYNRLKEAYIAQKRYDDAIRLIDQRLRLVTSPVLQAEKGKLFYLKGDEKRAWETWEEALTQTPDRPGTYRAVYYALFQLRLFEQAIDVLERARTHFHDPALFRTDLAYLYGLTGALKPAIREYLHLLEQDPRQLPFVKSRINHLLEQEGALPLLIAETERAIRRDPLNRAYRELAAFLYFEARDYTKALNTYRAIDQLEQEQGRALFTFAQTAIASEAFAAAREALQEILTQYPESPLAPSALLLLGNVLEQEAELSPEGREEYYRKALEVYSRFLTTYPDHVLNSEALYRRAFLLHTVFHQLEDARRDYQKLIKQFPDADFAARARFQLGLLALQEDRLTEAQLIFSHLEEDLRIGELAEQARLEQARIDFYQGQIASALLRLRAMDGNTASDVANDAIALKVLIAESQGPDSLNTPLRLYAQARLRLRQHRVEEALQWTDSFLVSFPQHPLADDAYLLKARILRQMGQSAQALALLGDLPLRYPQSPHVEEALFLIGEIYEQDLLDFAAARQAYESFLMRFPASLQAPRARDRIRALRNES